MAKPAGTAPIEPRPPSSPASAEAIASSTANALGAWAGPQIDAPDAIARPAVGLGFDYRSGVHLAAHQHRKGQLVFASSGVMTVSTQAGTWTVPSQRAVWVPPETEHEIDMSGEVRMRTVYLDAEASAGLPQHCCVVSVSPLLRELIVRCIALPQPYPLGGAEERLVTVLIDQIETTPIAPLHLPLPTDERLVRIVDALRTDPADDRPLTEWSKLAGASPRTLARLFHREVGMSFGAWRRQLRLLAALKRLAAGESVTQVALSLGYDSPSAFIAMFHRNLGQTPGRYFAEAPSTGGAKRRSE